MKRAQYTPKKRAAILAYAEEHGVSTAASHFKINSSLVYKWRKGLEPENLGPPEAPPKSVKSTRPNGPLLDIITYANKALKCIEARDIEGVELYIKHIRRAAQGKE